MQITTVDPGYKEDLVTMNKFICINITDSNVKACSNVLIFSPSPKFDPVRFFSIVSMATVTLKGRMGVKPIQPEI